MVNCNSFHISQIREASPTPSSQKDMGNQQESDSSSIGSRGSKAKAVASGSHPATNRRGNKKSSSSRQPQQRQQPPCQGANSTEIFCLSFGFKPLEF